MDGGVAVMASAMDHPNTDLLFNSHNTSYPSYQTVDSIMYDPKSNQSTPWYTSNDSQHTVLKDQLSNYSHSDIPHSLRQLSTDSNLFHTVQFSHGMRPSSNTGNYISELTNNDIDYTLPIILTQQTSIGSLIDIPQYNINYNNNTNNDIHVIDDTTNESTDITGIDIPTIQSPLFNQSNPSTRLQRSNKSTHKRKSSDTDSSSESAPSIDRTVPITDSTSTTTTTTTSATEHSYQYIKKLKHQQTDRVRRARIKNHMDELKSLVVSDSKNSDKVTHAAVISASVIKINQLHQKLQQLQAENKSLKISNKSINSRFNNTSNALQLNASIFPIMPVLNACNVGMLYRAHV